MPLTRRSGLVASAEAGFAGRAAGTLFVLGGVFGFASLAFPGGSGTSLAASAVTSAAALAVGLLIVAYGRSLSGARLQLLGVVATGLAAVSAVYGGAEGWLNGFYFFWIALYGAYFFTRAALALQLVVIVSSYAPALVANDSIRHPWLVWFVTSSTVAVTAGVVAVLRERLDRALAAEHAQVEKLRELDTLKDNFIATMSHEIRTPVAAIYGATQTLLVRDLPQSKRLMLLQVAHQQAIRVADLAEGLLLSASIDRRELRVRLREIDPVAVTLEAVEAARAGAPQRAIVFDGVADDLRVIGDGARLQQCVAVLLDNALKYGPIAGAVEVHVRGGSERVEILVCDEGPGIPVEEHQRIFERFHRLDPEMASGVGGSGLGLHIARGLMRAMGGEARVAASDRGTWLCLELPLIHGTAGTQRVA